MRQNPPPLLVLHVCTGNICRSPMAELLMRAELDQVYGASCQDVVLDGAGTYSGHSGQPINPPAGRVLAEIDVESSGFRAQALTRAAVDAADLVLCAAEEHVRAVRMLAPEATAKVFTLQHLGEVSSAFEGRGAVETADPVGRLRMLRAAALECPPIVGVDYDIDDPYGCPDDVYRATRDKIRGLVSSIVSSREPRG